VDARFEDGYALLRVQTAAEATAIPVR